MLNEHVLLIGNSDTGLGALSVALGGLEDSLELVDIDFLVGAIFLLEIELVVVECEPGGSSPDVTVVAVDGRELADVSERVSLSGLIIPVVDLVKIGVPT